MSKDFFETKNSKQLCKLLRIPESEACKIDLRRNFIIAIKKTVEKNKWTHAQAAEKSKVGRTVITAILNGNLEKISTDRLIDITHNLGMNIKLKVV